MGVWGETGKKSQKMERNWFREKKKSEKEFSKEFPQCASIGDDGEIICQSVLKPNTEKFFRNLVDPKFVL